MILISVPQERAAKTAGFVLQGFGRIPTSGEAMKWPKLAWGHPEPLLAENRPDGRFCPACQFVKLGVEGLLGVNIHTVGVIIYFRIGALIALIIAGGKLADHNYNIIVECWVIGACLVTLFSIAIYNLSKQKN